MMNSRNYSTIASEEIQKNSIVKTPDVKNRKKFPNLASKRPDVNNQNQKYHQLIDQLLNSGKTVQITLKGMSMFPILFPGDSVQIRRVTLKEIKPGQVVVFEREGQWIAHRLMVKDEKQGYLLTRGDGLPRNDAPIPFQQVKGIVTKVVKSRSPLARSINTFFDRWMVWLAPVTGRLFWYAGRAAVWGLRGLKGLMC